VDALVVLGETLVTAEGEAPGESCEEAVGAGELGQPVDHEHRRGRLKGGIEDIRNYCETDVLNTYLIFLRFEFMRGRLDASDLAREFELVRSALAAMERPHLDEFLAAWPRSL
jgi:predicted PolB exonuclease-like 3'-5' exonuclease